MGAAAVDEALQQYNTLSPAHLLPPHTHSLSRTRIRTPNLALP